MIFISFILDGILSTILSKFMPLLTLSSIVISSYYKDRDTLLKEVVIIGILYDVTYTDTIVLNSFIFFCLTLILFYLKHIFRNNLLNIILINILIIMLYLVTIYLILIIYKYINVNIIEFLISTIKSSFINTIYIVLLYLIIHKKIKLAYN